jgi:serine/threonine protein kinase
MKHCPVCDKSYADEFLICAADGATLSVQRSDIDPYVGKMIGGRFRVVNRLGEGTRGTDYLAEQVTIQRKVVVKILRARRSGDEEFVKRFNSEARLAAGLSHRSIVTILDFGQIDDGALFIALEFVDGTTLRDLIKQKGALDIAKAVRLGIQLAEGLAVAHENGITHRDIKPDTIMVLGDADALKIMDFGIAKCLDDDTATLSTQMGAVMGTPEYMAPEQVNGSQVSEQTDIYSFGVVLYEMLTGKVPLKAATPGATLVKQISEIPSPIRQVRKDVPESVEQAVMRCLEKLPENRPKTMTEVAAELTKASQAPREKIMATTIFSTRAMEPNSSQQNRLGRKTVIGVSLAALMSASYFFFAGNSIPVASTPSATSRTEEPKEVQASETQISMNDQTRGDEKVKAQVPSPAETPTKIAQDPAVVPEIKKMDAKQLAATVRKADEPTPATDNRKRIEDALRRLEERQGKTQKPPAPAPPPPPAPPKPVGTPPPAQVPNQNQGELAQIRGLVEDKLRSQGLLKVSESDRWGVTVVLGGGGVVTLRGLLRDERLRQDAVKLTRDVPGVTEVRTSIALPDSADKP